MALLPLLLLAASLLVCPFDTIAQPDVPQIVTVRGSGTTNPSKLLWRIFDSVEAQAGSPVHLTYRAVGSSTGIAEFVGDADSGFQPYSDFGSADVPLPRSEYDKLEQQGVTVLQIPFVLGAVSVFTTVPAGLGGLKLSPCVLAKIFKLEIITWDHPDIMSENPGLGVDPGSPITVVRRSDGSSSTAGLTAYLSKACPEVWAAENVGNSVSWPEGTTAAQGSGGVTSAMEATPFGITYLSSGHGRDAGLLEVAIQNLDGNYLTWPESDVGNALLQAENLPTDYTADMSQIDLIHLQGANTWPISQLSYLFLRADQTAKPETGALLKTVARILFDAQVQADMFPQYGFTALPAQKLSLALNNLEKLQLASGVEEWTIEDSTIPLVGQGPRVLSAKRKSWVEEELENISTEFQKASSQLDRNLARSVHGSGTTNPSGLLWHIMELLEDRASIPISMTYRAVGSSTGQAEFIGADNGYEPYNDFGSGDLPLSEAQYQELRDAGHQVVQIPFMIGAVSVFHDIPGSIVGQQGLHLDSCLLAKIFQGDIKTWDHPEIIKQNPEMNGKVSKRDKITVFHRDLGSSSTAGFTNYIQKACPDVWRLGAGTVLDTWPEDFQSVQGSQGMVQAISSTPFSIGYVDAGYGWNHNLKEISLKNKDGEFLTTKTADVPEAARIAVTNGIIPSSSSADFSGVDLLDQPGKTTWPISLFSYFYLRQNLDPLGPSGPILVALLQFLHSEEAHAMFGDFGFFPPPQEVIDLNLRGIGELLVAPGVDIWSFEDPGSTIVGGGAQPFVFSGKRHSYTKYQAQLLSNRVEALEEYQGVSGSASSMSVRSIPDELATLKEQNASLQIISIVAIVMALLSLILSASLIVLIMCRNSSATGNPCPNPSTLHVPMKEVENGSFAEDVTVNSQ